MVLGNKKTLFALSLFLGFFYFIEIALVVNAEEPNMCSIKVDKPGWDHEFHFDIKMPCYSMRDYKIYLEDNGFPITQKSDNVWNTSGSVAPFKNVTDNFFEKMACVGGNYSINWTNRWYGKHNCWLIARCDDTKATAETRSDSKLFDFCLPLSETTILKVDKTDINIGESYTVDWSSPKAYSCSLEITGSEKEIDGTITTSKNIYSISQTSGSHTEMGILNGIHTISLECTGILNAKIPALAKVGKLPPIIRQVKIGDISISSPIVTLKVEPASIKKGESATLSWTSNNAASVSINQGIGIVRPSGSIRVSPDFTTRYTISASGEFPEQGIVNSSVTLKILAPEIKKAGPSEEIPPEEKPIEIKPVEKLKVDLRINGQKGPLTMSAPAIFNISWNLDKYCLTYGSWLGIKTKAGEERQTQTKPGTYTYNMYCPTIGTDSVEVKIIGGVSGGQAAIPLPVAEASISADNINFSNKIRVIRGEPTDIWLSAGYDVTGDQRASRDDSGKWTAMSNGGQCQFNYDLNQGVPSFEAATDNPETAKTCTIPLGKLTFYDQPGVYRYGILRLIQGDNKVSNVSYVTIAVQEPPPPETPPIINLRINNLEGPSLALGAPAEYTISWNVANADTCQALDSWEGNKFMAGSEKFVSSEKKEFVYTLSCTGKLGTTVKSINLKVAELPICDFSAEPAVLNKESVFDQQSVLSWKCKFANTCSISPDIGTKIETFGSARVSPKITTNYNLSCANLEGNANFIQTVEVK